MNSIPTIITCLAILPMVGCGPEQHRHEEKARLLVTSPLRKDVEMTKEYVSQIRAIQHIEVRALERGYVQGIFVDEGQHVKRGQRMFQIMPAVYQAELQKAEAEAEFAKIEFENTTMLADGGVVSPNELALAQAKLDQARAELALAKAHRSLTEIRAPFDGIMGRFHVRQGSLAEEGELLTTLSDNSSVWVYFNMSESEYLEYESRERDRDPTPVRLVMANGTLFDQVGRIETTGADFNNETGNITFRATFPNPNNLLRHGQTGKILVSLPLDDVIVIPQKATFAILDKNYVFVVDEKNVVESREITVAAEMPHLYVVEGGLSEHETILLEGLRKVTNGSEIEPRYKQPKEILASLELPAE